MTYSAVRVGGVDDVHIGLIHEKKIIAEEVARRVEVQVKVRRARVVEHRDPLYAMRADNSEEIAFSADSHDSSVCWVWPSVGNALRNAPAH